MNQGKLVFAQLMQHLPLTTFRRCVARYQGEHKVQSFSCLDQFLSMAFAQLTGRESLRDIEACLRAQGQINSPLLANIYLHHVLDVWFETEVKPRLRGKAFATRR